jgi:hypothetical protein
MSSVVCGVTRCQGVETRYRADFSEIENFVFRRSKLKGADILKLTHE